MLPFLTACSQAPDPAGPLADAPPAVAHEGHAHPNVDHAHHRFDDPEKWAKVFDDPERDAWQKPDVVVAGMGLSAGMVVADIGAGTGYFNARLARAVGPEGKVIAVDIEPTLVEHMAARAAREGTPQVEARLTTAASHGLADGEVDRVLLVDTFHHIEGRAAYFGSLRAAMKPGGKLVIVDLKADAPFGPPPEMRLSAEQVTAELEGAGWVREGAIDGLPYQYALIFGVRP